MRRWLIAAAVAIIVVVSVGVALGWGWGAPAPQPQTRTPAVVEVRRTTLSDHREVAGQLSHGTPRSVTGETDGKVTWLAKVGSTVDRGDVLFRVNNQPVVLLYGALPMYRSLAKDTEGPDVTQFEENLHALGYRGFTVDSRFSDATVVAVRRWQKALGLPETGVVDVGWVIYAKGKIRVAEHKIQVGGVGTGEVVMITGVDRVVTVDMPVADRRLAVKGAQALVVLPDGASVAGVVADVGSVASSSDSGGSSGGQGDAEPTVELRVRVADQARLGTLDESPVTVRFVAEERRDVLAVPVTALLALAEGGYGLRVVDGGSRRIVPVSVGLFASGLVEVTGDGLVPGMKVEAAG